MCSTESRLIFINFVLHASASNIEQLNLVNSLPFSKLYTNSCALRFFFVPAIVLSIVLYRST